MDSEGPILTTSAFDHITRGDVERVLDRFRGDIMQVPPMCVIWLLSSIKIVLSHRFNPYRFSALKMDGKPLYEYARESRPLPRPIPTRKCTVSIDLVDFTPASTSLDDGGHAYRWPTTQLSVEEKEVFRRLTEIVSKAQAESPETSTALIPDLTGEQCPETSSRGLRPATFTVKMTVSSGTYVRSIVHEIGLALGSAAHVVKLTRTRQGEFRLHDGDGSFAQGITAQSRSSLDGVKGVKGNEDTSSAEPSTICMPWSIWERANAERKAILAEEKAGKQQSLAAGDSNEEVEQQYGDEAIFTKRRTGELKEWENELLKRFVTVPVPISGTHGPAGPAYKE